MAELLLKHYARYLKGSKDPDDTFKDFQNHVIHVSQNNWGGAPRMCQQWLDKSVQHLRAGEWSEAAYACGVLSHYFTDPIMPLHTGQTERESVVHRPMEWSVCKAYEEIHQLCQFGRAPRQIKLADGDDWISQAVLQGAAMAHEHYTRLIEIYNLARGTVDPPRGLTKEARQILAELFDLAMGGWASILMRIASMLDSVPPDCSLTLATVIAGIDMPRAAVIKKFTNAAQQAEVKRIFDEYTETGKVIDNLPAEIKVVRKEYAKSLKEAAASQSALTDPAHDTHKNVRHKSDNEEVVATQSIAPPPPRPEPAAMVMLPVAATKAEPIEEEEPSPKANSKRALAEDNPESVSSETEIEQPRTEPETKNLRASENTRADVANEPRLTFDSPLVDAPSIGPRRRNASRRLAFIRSMIFYRQMPAKWLSSSVPAGSNLS